VVKETLLNTKGAAERMQCTENWIHKLVYSGKLKAYIYDQHGVLVEREPNTPRQGQGLYFYEKDLKAYKGRKKGRPAGSKDKKPRTSKVAENSSITP